MTLPVNATVVLGSTTTVSVAPPSVSVNLGAQGPQGTSAKVSIGLSLSGPFGPRAAILPSPIILSGAGVLTSDASHAQAFKPCTDTNVWSVTKNGTFASETTATDEEVSSALFATITFPAGPGSATIAYPNGGEFADGDVLRLWESDSPDATQANTSLTLAGD